MTCALKPYPLHKDSGVPWLGDVPEHWHQLPGRACFQECKTPNTGLVETTVLSLSYGRIVVKAPESLHGLVPASFETYQIVEPGEIIVRPTDLQNDWNSLRFAICRNRGIITSAYLCFRARRCLTPGYGHLLLHSYDLMKVFYGLGSGLRQNLDWEDFKYLPCLAPPLLEQSAIVRFLAHTDRQINRLIGAKRRMIELLNEEKQAIIHRAVTRGLAPNVRLKPSGVEWLGDVPEHWDVKKITRCFRLIGSGTTPPTGQRDYYDNGTIPWVVTGDLNDTYLLSPSHNVTDIAVAQFSALKIYPRGTLLVAMYGATIGKAAVLSVPACVNQACCALGEPIGLSNEFGLVLLLAFRRDIISLGVGGGQPNVSQDVIRGLRLPIPPILEQGAIVDFINARFRDIERSINSAEREISLLLEYRTRLVADVVTGRLDVREAVLGLPEEVKEHELPDDGDGSADTEAEGIDEFDAIPEEEDV